MSKWRIEEENVLRGISHARELLRSREMTRDGFIEAMVPLNPGETREVMRRIGIEPYRRKRQWYVRLP